MLTRKLRQRVRSVLHRARFERELDTELQFHVDMLTAQYVGRGMAPDAARQAALHAFGPVAGVKDHVRDAWLSRVLESAVQDVRYGLRALAAVPAFTLGVVLTMALAVGVNTAIFGVTYSILLKPLPFHRPDRLVTLQHVTPQTASTRTFSIPELADYRRVPSLEAVAELHTMWFILLGRPTPERVSTGVVSPNYFDLLGVKPLLGRGLLASDDAPGAPAVLLLSHEFWTRGTDRDPAIVGRVFEMNDRPHTVVGVLPPFPDYPQGVDVYMPTSACPFRSGPNVAAGRTMRMVRAIARVRDGVSAERLAADLATTSATLERDYPTVYLDDRAPADRRDPYRATAERLADDMRAPIRSTLLLLIGTGALVLLIACVSVSNLTLARMTLRAGEVSLRAALGATRQRLLRQLLTENAAVAVLGATAGLLLAHVALGGLTAYVQRGTALPVSSGLTVAAVACAAATSIVLLFGATTVPFVVSRRRGISWHGEMPRPHATRIRYGLVVGQVGLSFVLMIAAALSVRSLLHLQGIDTGFSTEHVQTMRVDLNFTKYRTLPTITGFWRRFEHEMTRIEGVVSAGGAGTMPLDGRQLGSSIFQLEPSYDGEKGSPAPMRLREEHAAAHDVPPGDASMARVSRANLRVASPGYFAALGQRLLAGRAFTLADADEMAPVVVVNESLARRHWPAGGALGRRLRIDGVNPTTVVGVVEDTRQTLDRPAGEEIYFPLLQSPQLSTNWLVRSSLPPDEIERQVRALVRAIDPEQPVDNFRSLESFRADSLLPSRVTAVVVSLFSLLALVITATGIAGVIGFAVQQRRHEFGVRLALGARPLGVVGMVLGDALRLVCVGLTLGTLASAVLFPVLRNVLSGVDRFDAAAATTLAAVATLLLLVAALAGFIPARRAASVDPLLALRKG